jgi:hypothetical protein
MLLEFKASLSNHPWSVLWINPRDVAAVEWYAWDKGDPRVRITLTCGKQHVVYDPDGMVAKIIRDAQLEGGW